jgi:hypothetical protein
VVCDLYAEDTTRAQRMDMAVRTARAALADPQTAADGAGAG